MSGFLTPPPYLFIVIQRPLERPLTRAVQLYPDVDPSEAPLSVPMPKLESRIQASGEAAYTDDIGSKMVGPCLNAAYVTSNFVKVCLVPSSSRLCAAKPVGALRRF